MTRIRVSNRYLPGVESERTITTRNEEACEDVFLNGTYVGQILYVRRTLKSGGSQYGWRPAKGAGNVRLTSKVDAIRRLPRMAEAVR